MSTSSIGQSANFVKANLSFCRRGNRDIKSSIVNVLRLWLFSNASTHDNDSSVGPQSRKSLAHVSAERVLSRFVQIIGLSSRLEGAYWPRRDIDPEIIVYLNMRELERLDVRVCKTAEQGLRDVANIFPI